MNTAACIRHVIVTGLLVYLTTPGFSAAVVQGAPTNSSIRPRPTSSARTYQAGVLHLGRIGLESVASVAISESRRNLDGTTTDVVDFLRLREGSRITIANLEASDGPPTLVGYLAPSTPGEPSSFVSGTFTWKDQALVDADIRSFRISLVRVSTTSRNYGAPLSFPPSAIVNLSARGPLVLKDGGAAGTLELVTPLADLPGVTIQWGIDRATWNLVGRRVTARFDLSGSQMDIEGATFTAAPGNPASLRPELADYFPGHIIRNTAISFENTQLHVSNTALRLRATRITAKSPQLTFESWPNTPVAAVATIAASEVESGAGRWADEALVFPRPQASRVSVETDPVALVDRVNTYSFVNSNDTLIPTGDERIPYATLSAYTAFHNLATRSAIQSINSIGSRHATPAAAGPIATRITDPATRAAVELYVKNKVFAEVKFDAKTFNYFCDPSDAECLEKNPGAQLVISFGTPATAVAGAARTFVAKLIRPGVREALRRFGLERAVHPAVQTVLVHLVGAMPKIAEQGADAILSWQLEEFARSPTFVAWSDAIRRGDFASAHMIAAYSVLRPIVEMEATLRADQMRGIEQKYAAAKRRNDEAASAEGRRVSEEMRRATPPNAGQPPATAPGTTGTGTGEPGTASPSPSPCPPGKQCLETKPKPKPRR